MFCRPLISANKPPSLRPPRVSLKPKTPFSFPRFYRQQAQMTDERRTANEMKTMALELARERPKRNQQTSRRPEPATDPPPAN